jgi:hypothetical protein
MIHFNSHFQLLLVAIGENLVETFQNLRADQHDSKREKPGGQQESGQQNPEEPPQASITPPKQEKQTEKTGEGTFFTENLSWNCACN